ncbi:hypothetical protein [Actinomadura sp. 6N118]|uniref:hypothetical protein n=1 Tax=Actinomadura sp. 6N118 TaxID=3375151 RepID=UPI0037A2407E
MANRLVPLTLGSLVAGGALVLGTTAAADADTSASAAKASYVEHCGKYSGAKIKVCVGYNYRTRTLFMNAYNNNARKKSIRVDLSLVADKRLVAQDRGYKNRGVVFRGKTWEGLWAKRGSKPKVTCGNVYITGNHIVAVGYHCWKL